MQDLGRAALALALGLALYALAGGALGAYAGRRRVVQSARNALFACFGASALASLVLLNAFRTRDFSFVYVAEHSSTALPFPYEYTAFWGGQAGSLLLWLTVLTGLSTAAVALNRRLTSDVLPWTVPVLGGVTSFFALLLFFVASPFATQTAPADGAGLNPTLQNPYMMIHPPLLYLGYVGLTLPFAFAAAALLSGRTDERWIVATRRWTILAWTALGIGILLGAKWAYEEVGWGGYYAWDPVENAALMPWLAATAFLHSVMVQEKKNMLRVWNAALVALAFCLSIFGTFLTRSGLINSIHSFAQSPIGAWFLAFICIAAAFSVALIVWRLPLLRARTKLERLRPGETMHIRNYALTYIGSEQQRTPNHQELRARIAVRRDGAPVGTLLAGKNAYFAEQQTSNEVAIHTDWLRAEDLFVIGDEFKFKGNAVTAVYLKVLLKPLVNLIWLAGLVFLLGSAIALWPDAREQRRLAARTEPGAVPATP